MSIRRKPASASDLAAGTRGRIRLLAQKTISLLLWRADNTLGPPNLLAFPLAHRLLE
jgi:hypothetical protein